MNFASAADASSGDSIVAEVSTCLTSTFVLKVKKNYALLFSELFS
jgi:hypothetical protein